MNVWIVTVGNRINSVWPERESAQKHAQRLIEVNGDQIAVQVRDYEVRS